VATTTETWEVWAEDHYIKGKLLKTFKNKDSAVKYAKKHIKFKKIEPCSNNTRKKKEFFLDNEDGRAVGMIIKRP